MLEALDEIRESKAANVEEPGPAAVELAVRCVLPLVAGGALLGERNMPGLEQPDRRQPWQVIDAMRQTTRGVRQLGEVLREQIEGKKAFRAVDAAGSEIRSEKAGDALRLSDAYLRNEYPDPGKVPLPRPSGDQVRDVYHERVHDLQAAFERLEFERDQVRACREPDGTLLAEKYGVDYRACRKWLDLIHSIAKDLAIWEKADVEYIGRRPGDDDAAERPDDTADFAAGEDQADDEALGSGAEKHLAN